ncbi:hypothetical protein P3342_008710 [Pyrenophora teres f. teres]|nr:hypothetical protein P3342_008710 [Pyrenophora teres f. teres]
MLKQPPEYSEYIKIFQVDELKRQGIPCFGLFDFRAGHLEPNYNKSAGQVFADTAAYIVRFDGHLEILKEISHSETYDGDEGYASWAPRWDILEPAYNFYKHSQNFSACADRRIFWTLGGSYGLGPLCMRADGIVVVLYGYGFLLVLRSRGDEYLFLGEVYVDKIMHGELVEEVEQGRRQEQVFCLI